MVHRVISNFKAYVEGAFHGLPKAHMHSLCGLVQLKIQPQGCKGWLHGAAPRDVPHPCLALRHRSHRDGPAEDAFDLALSRLQFREPNYAGGTQPLSPKY